MFGGIAMQMITPQDNSMYALLTDESKRTVDAVIEFLYSKQENIVNEETARAIEDVNNRVGMIGPFESIEDLMVSLDA